MGKHAQYRNLVAATAAAALLAAAPPTAAARDGGCRLALAFALDVSASVNPEEYSLQLDGLAQALTDPAVRAALLSGGGVALAAYEWSGRNQQVMVADWTMVADDAALDGFAAAIAAHPRNFTEFPTAVGYALGYGAVLLHNSPPCRRKALDVSGDGLTNDGFGPVEAYRHFDFEGVTVNGLVVGSGNPEVKEYYRSLIAHGPGAFVEAAADYTDFARAMRRKILREVGMDFVATAQ